MKNTFGQQITYTLFGESHGDAIGIVIDGLPAGIKINQDFLLKQMDKRKAKGKISTQRHEMDQVEFISGYFKDHTTGSPLTILIKNQTMKSSDYEALQYRVRPGHSDFTANEKYHGYQDYRGGGHFSGRLTAPIVAAGAIALQLLRAMGIEIGSHIKTIKDIQDRDFSDHETTLLNEIREMNDKDFAVLDESKEKVMIALIEETAKAKDSVGGILETAIVHVPTGIGEPFFDSIESTLSHLLFSIPAVKGVEFGLGFNFHQHFGSEVNDPFYYDGNVKTKTNNNGGINGGISNGMPILIKTVVKPTPSIYKQQESINLKTLKNELIEIEGRHDPAIIHRARVVVDSMVAIGILELIMQRNGCESINIKEEDL
ncbi:MAG: chorismate synthase [Erysipelotrichaceae bacterium]